MNTFPKCGSSTRSLDAAHPVDIHALLLQSIDEQIDAIIQRHPTCPKSASYEVDALIRTAERLVGE